MSRTQHCDCYFIGSISRLWARKKICIHQLFNIIKIFAQIEITKCKQTFFYHFIPFQTSEFSNTVSGSRRHFNKNTGKEKIVFLKFIDCFY